MVNRQLRSICLDDRGHAEYQYLSCVTQTVSMQGGKTRFLKETEIW